jgi:hypothetical protein
MEPERNGFVDSILAPDNYFMVDFILMYLLNEI